MGNLTDNQQTQLTVLTEILDIAEKMKWDVAFQKGKTDGVIVGSHYFIERITKGNANKFDFFIKGDDRDGNNGGSDGETNS